MNGSENTGGENLNLELLRKFESVNTNFFRGGSWMKILAKSDVEYLQLFSPGGDRKSALFFEDIAVPGNRPTEGILC